MQARMSACQHWRRAVEAARRGRARARAGASGTICEGDEHAGRGLAGRRRRQRRDRRQRVAHQVVRHHACTAGALRAAKFARGSL